MICLRKKKIMGIDDQVQLNSTRTCVWISLKMECKPMYKAYFHTVWAKKGSTSVEPDPVTRVRKLILNLTT